MGKVLNVSPTGGQEESSRGSKSLLEKDENFCRFSLGFCKSIWKGEKTGVSYIVVGLMGNGTSETKGEIKVVLYPSLQTCSREAQ